MDFEKYTENPSLHLHRQLYQHVNRIIGNSELLSEIEATIIEIENGYWLNDPTGLVLLNFLSNGRRIRAQFSYQKGFRTIEDWRRYKEFSIWAETVDQTKNAGIAIIMGWNPQHLERLLKIFSELFIDNVSVDQIVRKYSANPYN